MTTRSRDHAEKLLMLERACASTQQVMLGAGEADVLGPTLLAEWNVWRLIEHLVVATTFFADVAQEEASPDDRVWPDVTEATFVTTFAEQAARLTAAFTSVESMAAPMLLPTGPTTGALCIEVATGEVFVHGWDLAAATGQDTDLDADVADYLRGSAWADLCDSLRTSDSPPFKAAVPVTSGAPSADRLAGFLGRHLVPRARP